MGMRRELVEQLFRGTCAVIQLKTPPKHDTDVPAFSVIGTGFVVDRDLVLTNRHVIEVHARLPVNERFLMFVEPHPTRDIAVSLLRGRVTLRIEKGADLGVIEFSSHKTDGFVATALPVAQNLTFGIGDDVATCGYMLGDDLLRSEHFGASKMRYGPVLLQGHVAAIAPFTVAPEHADAFLTDIRTGAGLSGGPVVLRDSGEVVGIHYAGETGRAGRIGIAFPLDRSRIDSIIAQYRTVAARFANVEERVHALVGQGMSQVDAMRECGLSPAGEATIDTDTDITA